jgi:hypothetical protein
VVVVAVAVAVAVTIYAVIEGNEANSLAGLMAVVIAVAVFATHFKTLECAAGAAVARSRTASARGN